MLSMMLSASSTPYAPPHQRRPSAPDDLFHFFFNSKIILEKNFYFRSEIKFECRFFLILIFHFFPKFDSAQRCVDQQERLAGSKNRI